MTWIIVGIVAYMFLTRRIGAFGVPPTAAGAANATSGVPVSSAVSSSTPGVDTAIASEVAPEVLPPAPAVSVDFQLPQAVLPTSKLALETSQIRFLGAPIIDRRAM